MKRLIIIITPFTLKQTLMTVENGTVIGSESFLLKDLNDIVFSKKDIEKIIFFGSKDYVQKFIDQLKKKELEEYQYNKITYEIKEP